MYVLIRVQMLVTCSLKKISGRTTIYKIVTPSFSYYMFHLSFMGIKEMINVVDFNGYLLKYPY